MLIKWSDSRGGPPRGEGLEDVMNSKKLRALGLLSWRQEGKVSVSKSNYRFPYLKCVMEKTEPPFSHWCTVKRQPQQSHMAAGESPAGHRRGRRAGGKRKVFHHEVHAPKPCPERSENLHPWRYLKLSGTRPQEICSDFDVSPVFKKWLVDHLQKSPPM